MVSLVNLHVKGLAFAYNHSCEEQWSLPTYRNVFVPRLMSHLFHVLSQDWFSEVGRVQLSPSDLGLAMIGRQSGIGGSTGEA
jgi:hypothetical protein